jgi:hypothetical protein
MDATSAPSHSRTSEHMAAMVEADWSIMSECGAVLKILPNTKPAYQHAKGPGSRLTRVFLVSEPMSSQTEKIDFRQFLSELCGR